MIFFNELCVQTAPHVLVLTETWFRNHNSLLLKIGNYKVYLKNREDYLHWGLAVYVRDYFQVKVRNDMRVNREMVFECMVWNYNIGTSNILYLLYLVISISLAYSLMSNWISYQFQLRVIFICGELNLDLRTVNINSKVREYLNTMLSYRPKPTINICSRGTRDFDGTIEAHCRDLSCNSH